jgi:hypothetical protein
MAIVKYITQFGANFINIFSSKTEQIFQWQTDLGKKHKIMATFIKIKMWRIQQNLYTILESENFRTNVFVKSTPG